MSSPNDSEPASRATASRAAPTTARAPYAIGVVGAGKIAETMHLPVLTSMPEVRVAWITDRDGGRARAVARAYGIEGVSLPDDPAALPECDVALLAIPPGVRRPYYEAFASRGIAVMAEKPFALDAEQHAELAGLFPAHRIGCAYQRRHCASTLLVKRILREQWFGPLRSMRIGEGDRVKKSQADESHYEDPKLAGGGVLMTQGCHTLDWLLYVTGAKRPEILECALIFDGDLDREASARLRFGGEGCVPGAESAEVDLCVSWLAPQINRIEMCFDAVELRVGVKPELPVAIRARRSDGAGFEHAGELVAAKGQATTWNQTFYLEWREFLEGLESGVPSSMSAQSALATSELMDALYREVGRP